MVARGKPERPKEPRLRKLPLPRQLKRQRQQSPLHQNPQLKTKLRLSKPVPMIRLCGKRKDDHDVILQTKKTRLCSRAFVNKVLLGSPYAKTRHSKSMAELQQICVID
jgi:hypothetical protein